MTRPGLAYRRAVARAAASPVAPSPTLEPGQWVRARCDILPRGTRYPALTILAGHVGQVVDHSPWGHCVRWAGDTDWGVAIRDELEPITTECAACGATPEGNHCIHRDGAYRGPIVLLCDECGGAETPDLATIWARIKERRLAADELCAACESAPPEFCDLCPKCEAKQSGSKWDARSLRRLRRKIHEERVAAGEAVGS